MPAKGLSFGVKEAIAGEVSRSKVERRSPDVEVE